MLHFDDCLKKRTDCTRMNSVSSHLDRFSKVCCDGIDRIKTDK